MNRFREAVKIYGDDIEGGKFAPNWSEKNQVISGILRGFFYGQCGQNSPFEGVQLFFHSLRWVVMAVGGVGWVTAGLWSCGEEDSGHADVKVTDGAFQDGSEEVGIGQDVGGDGSEIADIIDVVPLDINPVPALGNGDGSPESVTWEVLVGPTWLFRPTDVAFGGRHRDECWVTDHAADAFVVVTDLESRNPTIRRFIDYRHLYAQAVTSITFGDRGTFASCQESVGATVGKTPTYLAGPTLWPASISLFETLNDSTLKGPYLERMRSSPLCMGIEAVGNQVYYAINGLTGDIDRYDFAPLSRPGGKGKPSGNKVRMAEGVVTRVPNVPSHMVFDAETGWLYIVDTGKARVVRMDTQSGVLGNLIFTNPDPGTVYNKWKDVVIEEFVTKESEILVQPSGIVLIDGFVVVSDYATGKIFAFDSQRKLKQTLDTGRGAYAVCGLDVDRMNRLVFVDSLAREVVRVHP